MGSMGSTLELLEDLGPGPFVLRDGDLEGCSKQANPVLEDGISDGDGGYVGEGGQLGVPGVGVSQENKKRVSIVDRLDRA